MGRETLRSDSRKEFTCTLTGAQPKVCDALEQADA
jgi:hypothetical protein